MQFIHIGWNEGERYFCSRLDKDVPLADSARASQNIDKAESHGQKHTYCNTKQGPLDSCPFVLPTINDHDEAHIC